MPLPSALREAVDREIAVVDRPKVARAAEQITSDYKAGRFEGSIASTASCAAYLITRLPATYASCGWVFAEVARRIPDFAPTTLLDLGAEPGTASWAAMEEWTSLRSFFLFESNREFAEIGQRMTAASPALSAATWVIGDMQSQAKLPPAELVVMSYALGELPDTVAVLEKAWAATTRLLVVIEPGTPRHFEQVATARRQLLAKGAGLVAPCPHELECPMATLGDWCHFSVRLERTAEHRRLKRGALGYEDEKFSYLVLGKSPQRRAETRIVRHPMTHSGYIQLSLCTDSGLQQTTVARSQKVAFRAARRAKWGDEWRQLE